MLSLLLSLYAYIGLGYGAGRWTLIRKSSAVGWISCVLIWPVGLFIELKQKQQLAEIEPPPSNAPLLLEIDQLKKEVKFQRQQADLWKQSAMDWRAKLAGKHQWDQYYKGVVDALNNSVFNIQYGLDHHWPKDRSKPNA